MASGKKQVQQLSRQLFKLSLVDGVLSAERVAGVLEYVEKHPPAHPLAVLKAYRRLIGTEVARGRADIEHAGEIHPTLVEQIASVMTKKYGRKITGTTRRNDTLLAGLRIRIGDDVYASSVASQLAALAGAV
jgi:F-type H+-transporting ATPase subunit delta